MAVVDERYQRKWNEKLGHVVMFEALEGTSAAVGKLMDAACGWLGRAGAIAARAGFGMLEFPFVVDAYDALPPPFVRQNPAYYHSLLKDAGFESEKGWVDYKIEVTPELVRRWESALEGARRAGFEIVPLRKVAAAERASEFTRLWNETFKNHWGLTPYVEEEVATMFASLEPTGFQDTTLFALRGGEKVGVLWVVPDLSMTAALSPGRVIADSEKLNLLGIGVLETARGRGVNMAMAAYAYLLLARRGAKYVSYTMVLDDNWPSRRTAEKLGAKACASYLVYRRNFRG